MAIVCTKVLIGAELCYQSEWMSLIHNLVLVAECCKSGCMCSGSRPSLLGASTFTAHGTLIVTASVVRELMLR
jgi:hypothetical protein